MKPVPDRKKLRREFVKKRRVSMLRLSASMIVWLALWGLAGTLAAPLFANFRHPETHGLVARFREPVLALTLLGVVLYPLWHILKRAEREVASLPYVPRITVAELPAEAVLVRGAEEPPVTQSEGLLRAATMQETLQDELLRVNQEHIP